MYAERLFGKPLITPAASPITGDNIDNPTLIRVPEWIHTPLGKYYIYFSHHIGKNIRLAYSDSIGGPWKIYEPGTVKLADIPFLDQSKDRGHIASPEIYIDEDNKKIRMYFHGLLPTEENASNGKKLNAADMAYLNVTPADIKRLYNQITIVAESDDGIHFDLITENRNDCIEGCYHRLFRYEGYFYSVDTSGMLRVSKDGIHNFTESHNIFPDIKIRHCAFLDLSNACTVKDHLTGSVNGVPSLNEGDTLYILYTVRSDVPESIVYSKIILTGDPDLWMPDRPVLLLKAKTDYEGADLPVQPSAYGAARGREHHLRDPHVYTDGNKIYMVYAIAGESGIAAAQLFF